MTIEQKVAELIIEHYSPGELDKPFISLNHFAQDIAKKLKRANLLAPELPEPDCHTNNYEHGYAHTNEYGNDVGVPNVWKLNTDLITEVQTFPAHNQYIHIYYDEEPIEPLTIEEARQLAYTLLAAIDSVNN